jgi:HD-like signal output (HDOD) protein
VRRGGFGLYLIALISKDATLQQQIDSAVASLEPSLSLYNYADIPAFLNADIQPSMVIVDDISGQLSADLLQQVAVSHPQAIRVLCLPMMQDEQLIMQLGAFHLFYSRTLSASQLSELLFRPQLLNQLPLPVHAVKAVLAAHHLPVAAAVAVQLQDMLLDPDLAIDSLLPVVEQDAVLSSRLLQLANSPYMGFSRPTSSLEIAITRIGLNLVYGLVITLAAADVEPDAPMPDWLLWSWHHARSSRQYAAAVGLSLELQELSFSCALLSGIGEAVLRAEPAADGLLQLSSAQISAVLMTVWGFNHHYVRPVLMQEQVWKDLNSSEEQVAAVLGVAATLCPMLKSLSRQSISAAQLQTLPAAWLQALATVKDAVAAEL